MYGNGKPLDFEENLVEELGREYVDKMRASRFKTMKVDVHWYNEKIEYYKLKVKEYENNKR